ncbi:MAG TPA: ParB N-terminal domain-containing protein [bacterium]|nr:ParB N-terminal domain-containing protein [bacterium]
MLLQYLPLSNLNLADDSFRITYAPRLNSLKRSIRTVGLISPINVRHTPEGTYQIVTGYKRTLVLQELGRQSVPALVHEPADLSPTQAFLWNLHDNAITRQLNLIEKSTAIVKLSHFYSMSEEDLVKQFLPLLEEEPSYKILHNLLSLANLTEPMKNHVVMSDLALSSAARIAEFSPSTQQSLLPVLAHIRPSTNKLNELLSLIREISARDGCTVEEILSRYQLLQVVADVNTAPTDKLRALRQALRGLRLPQLSERQKQLASLIDSLNLPESAKLSADPYFENQKMKLEYQFSQPEELTHLINKIQEAFSRQQWHQIFDWYRA